jgi:hypothetical protein
MLGIGRGESYVIKQSGLWIQRDHTLDLESVFLADGVKGRVLIPPTLSTRISRKSLPFRPPNFFYPLGPCPHVFTMRFWGIQVESQIVSHSKSLVETPP